MFIDNPTLSSTDIIPIVNEAWSLSFARVYNNTKAISERGWGPLNRNLLTYKELLQTMTKIDRDSFKLPLSRRPEVLQVSDNNFASLDTSINFKKSSSAEFSLTSDMPYFRYGWLIKI